MQFPWTRAAKAAALDRQQLRALGEALPQIISDFKEQIAKAIRPEESHTGEWPLPTTFGMAAGVREVRPAGLPWDLLRRMARKTEPVTGVIKTRCNQVAAHAQVPAKRHETGFRCVMRDLEAKPTREDKKRAHQLERMLLNGGAAQVLEDDDEDVDSFDAFLRKLTRDSLTFDAMAFEVRPSDNGRFPVARFNAVDAGTIRLTDMKEYRPTTRSDTERVRYVQLLQSQVVGEFTRSELAYGVRDPDSDLNLNGYPVSELETLIHMVTAFLNARTYNTSYFTTNTVPAGVLSLVGNFDQKHLDAFRMQWEAQIAGVENAWKTPLMATRDGSGINYVPFRQSNRDMDYHLWIDFIITLCCAVYQIAAEEVGFSSWSPQRSAFSGESVQERITQSRDKGLKPLLALLKALIDRYILWPVDPHFMVSWQGVDPFDPMYELQLAEKRLNMGLSTPNEERALMDLEPTPESWGECPVNGILAQVWSQDRQMALQAQQQQPMQSQGDPMPYASEPQEGGENHRPGGTPIPANGKESPAGGHPPQGSPAQGSHVHRLIWGEDGEEEAAWPPRRH